jgi:hypothetical protein|tara:strand:- start:891 stop:1079 length:189 start_codon:yes stop_codon:yes gene_type:complete
VAKNEKELQREKLAQDIKDYLAKGGKVRQFPHGACANEPVGQPTWETRNRPKMMRTKKGTII